MADEERNGAQEETPNEASAPEEASADADVPAAEQPDAEADAPEVEQPDAPGSQAEEASGGASEPPATDAAPADAPEPLSPKEARKLERSRAPGEARPERDASQRAAERAERRRAAAAGRRRYRQRSRERRGEPGRGTAPAERQPGPKKVRLGKVVSTKADKTITVQIELARRHPTYEKVVRRSATLHAHDAENAAGEGDTVRVVETRPLSKSKRWRLLEIVERAR